MQAALRKIGNSLGMIVPKSMVSELGVEAGTRFDLAIVDGNFVASPAKRHPREGWAEAAAALVASGDDGFDEDWLAFPNDGDDDLTW